MLILLCDYNMGLGWLEKDEICLKSKGLFLENVLVRFVFGWNYVIWENRDVRVRFVVLW